MIFKHFRTGYSDRENVHPVLVKGSVKEVYFAYSVGREYVWALDGLMNVYSGIFDQPYEHTRMTRQEWDSLAATTLDDILELAERDSDSKFTEEFKWEMLNCPETIGEYDTNLRELPHSELIAWVVKQWKNHKGNNNAGE